MSVGDNFFSRLRTMSVERVLFHIRTVTLKGEDGVDILCKFIKLFLKIKGQLFFK